MAFFDNKSGSSIATSMVLEESPDRMLYYKLLYTITMFIMSVYLYLILSCFDMDIVYVFG